MAARWVQTMTVLSAGVATMSVLAVQQKAPTPTSSLTAGQTTVCVNKKNQTMAMPASGKCRRGWKKRSLGTEGPQGPPGAPGAVGPVGPAGPELSVKDAAGKVVGTFRGYQALGPDPQIAVARSDGLFVYNSGGRLQPSGHVYFTTVNCTGQAYLVTAIAMVDETLAALGSGGLAVTRATFPTYSPARAFRLTDTWTGQQTKYYELSNGSCTLKGELTIGLIEYEEVPAPADFSGPLTVG